MSETPNSPTWTKRLRRSFYRPKGNRKPPTKWLSVPQLYHTAVEVVQATMFARFADQRQMMASCPRELYELGAVAPGHDPHQPIWVDYVADTGDGYDATLATARCLVGGPGVEITGATRGTPADLLVFGGDQVYPVASRDNYIERLYNVLGDAREAAGLDRIGPGSPLVALPGNHDWYDGLASFRRSFCESWVKSDRSTGPMSDVPVNKLAPDEFGGWTPFQSRSYFALHLRDGWWLWGIDSQLNGPIDAEQLSYFRQAANRVGKDEALILCTATPSWLEAAQEAAAAGDGGPSASQTASVRNRETPLTTLLWFIERVLGRDGLSRVALILTGDDHHFAHYAPADAGPHLVTCGGGGAFLTSTHHLPDGFVLKWHPWMKDPSTTTHYTLQGAYPESDVSANLLHLRNGGGFLRSAWRNGPSLPLLVGALDFVLLALPAMEGRRWRTVRRGVVLLGILGTFAARGAEGRRPGWDKNGAVASLLVGHLSGHVAGALAIARVARSGLIRRIAPTFVRYPAAFLASSVVGTGILVSYLRLADRWGLHGLEAFSGMRIDGYKCHLRLEVHEDDVRVHVIVIDDVPTAQCAELNDLPPLRARVLKTICVTRTKQLGEDTAPPVPSGPRDSRQA